MTQREHAAKAEVQAVIDQLRLVIVGQPKPANILGYVGLAFGLRVQNARTDEGKLIEPTILVNEEGEPVVALVTVLSMN